jgi:carboxypeptidase PM20D1
MSDHSTERRPRTGRFILRALGLLGVALALLAAVLVFRALTMRSDQIAVTSTAPVALDAAALAERLAQAIRIKTISTPNGDAAGEAEAFSALRALFAQNYPRVHAALSPQLINNCALVYRWQGKDAAQKPVLLMAHMDVVPGEVPFAPRSWTHPPFAGVIADGFIWGRGAWDDKSGVLGLLEATELLLAENHTPQRTVYFMFGCDEEVLGRRGAVAAAESFEKQSIRFAWVLDEGFAVTHGMVPGVAPPAAMIGLGEKGYFSVELSVEGEGGHSSTPTRETPIGILGGAVARLERNQMPAGLPRVASQMFDALAPEMPFGPRLVLANRWLFEPLVARMLLNAPGTAATIRTTTAPTMFNAGIKENVLPQSATAVVNFRIRPGDTSADVLRHIDEVVKDKRVRVRPLAPPAEPSRESAVSAEGFRTIARSIREVFPEVLVAPGLVLGGTDSRHFDRVADDIYRFLPVRIRNEDLPRFHGIDERISVDGYADSVRFYRQLLMNIR